jgi:hypothetical protein
MVTPITQARQTETFAQVVHRLAAKAGAEGSALYQDEVTGRWFASSRRNPGTLHQLTAVSCTCPGFIRHGMCGHLAMLLLELDYVPGPDPDPEPEPPAALSPFPVFAQIGAALDASDRPADYFERLAFGLTPQGDHEPCDLDVPDLLGIDCAPEDVRAYFRWQHDQAQLADAVVLAA